MTKLKPTDNTVLKGERLKTFPLRSVQDKDVHPPLLFTIVLEVLAGEIWQKRNKSYPYQEGKSKIVFACR